MIRKIGIVGISIFFIGILGCTKQDPLEDKGKEIRDAEFPEEKPIEDLSRFAPEAVQLDVSGSDSYSVFEGEELKLILKPRILNETLSNLEWVVDSVELPEASAKFTWSNGAGEFIWTPTAQFLGGNLVAPSALKFVVRSILNPRLFKAFTIQAHALQKLDKQPRVLRMAWPRGIDSAVTEGTIVRGTLVFEDLESTWTPGIPGKEPKVVVVSAGPNQRYLGNRVTVESVKAVTGRPHEFEAILAFSLIGYDIEPPLPENRVIRNKKIQFGLIVYSSTGYPSSVYPVELLVENKIKAPQMSGRVRAETVARGTQSTTWFQAYNSANESILSLKEINNCGLENGMTCGCEPRAAGDLPSRALDCFVRWTPSLTATQYLHTVSFVIESKNPAVDATQTPIETTFGRNFETTPLPPPPPPEPNPPAPTPPENPNPQSKGKGADQNNISTGGVR